MDAKYNAIVDNTWVRIGMIAVAFTVWAAAAVALLAAA